MTGIGLLYSEGYFRQIIDAGGWQHESYPSNDPGLLPIRPARGADGAWLQIPLDLPGRTLTLRVWRVQVGRVSLYLLDANSPLNSPADRGITGRLYEAGGEIRLLQALVLGIARVVDAVAPDTVVCHMDEGHAAFAVIERASSLRRRSQLSFPEAFWATRAGNVFTTHTSVEAGFDRFPPALKATYASRINQEPDEGGCKRAEHLALGRGDANDGAEPFNMAYLATRGAARRILTDRQRPAQLVLAGKAHPADDEGKRMIQAWITLAGQPELRSRVVFLEDYDIDLAAELVQGIDLWTNMPSRPWEACGTSGMKVLVNGGISLPVARRLVGRGLRPKGRLGGRGWGRSRRRRARCPETQRHSTTSSKTRWRRISTTATRQDCRRWLARIRRSMARLTPAYSSNRMLREYIDQLYLPAASEFHRRVDDEGVVALPLRDCECRLRRAWPQLHIGTSTVTSSDDDYRRRAALRFGVEIDAYFVGVDIAEVDRRGNCQASICSAAPQSQVASTAIFTPRPQPGIGRRTITRSESRLHAREPAYRPSWN